MNEQLRNGGPPTTGSPPNSTKPSLQRRMVGVVSAHAHRDEGDWLWTMTIPAVRGKQVVAIVYEDSSAGPATNSPNTSKTTP